MISVEISLCPSTANLNQHFIETGTINKALLERVCGSVIVCQPLPASIIEIGLGASDILLPLPQQDRRGSRR